MIRLALVLLLAGSAFGQSGALGAFTESADVGNPAGKGAAEFDAASGQYRITGSGANIWAQKDEFRFVWREMSGNFAVTATMQFLGKGEDHRKAGIMFRQSLDADAPYGDIVIHGNGMPGLQWRSRQGEITNAFDLPFDGPGKYRIKLVRNGLGLTVWMAKDGEELKETARTEVRFQNPVLVGLVVCSHKADASDTVVFSDVNVDQLAPPAPKK